MALFGSLVMVPLGWGWWKGYFSLEAEMLKLKGPIKADKQIGKWRVKITWGTRLRPRSSFSWISD